jgi:hypothetical protein
MKKILILVISIAMIVSMFGCSSTPASTTPSVMTTTPLGTTNKADTPTVPEIPSGNSTIITEDILRSMPENPASEFTYTSSRKVRGGLRIDSYTGSSDIVVIPEEIDGKPVVEIAVYTFATTYSDECKVRGVIIPKTVKSIKELFVNNDNLEIVIAEGLEEVGYLTFGNCFNVREIILGEDVTRLGEFAFGVCTALERIYIPSDTTEEIHEWAFFGSENITIYGKSGSGIETFAKEQGIPFVCEKEVI